MQGDGVSRGCLIPALQSLFAGVLSAGIVLGVALLANWSATWQPALIVGASVSFYFFWVSINRWRDDEYGPAPYSAPEPVQATVTSLPLVRIPVAEGSKTAIIDLPATPAQLRDLSEGLLSGMSFSEASWSGEGRIFSRSQFRGLRDEFIKRGWLRQRNTEFPNQGYEVSPSGSAVLRHLAQKEQ